VSEAHARETQQFSKHRHTLEEMAKLNMSSNLGRYQLAQLYYELTFDTDLPWESIDQYLVDNYQCQILSKGSMSKLRSVYETWVKISGLGMHELAPFSPYLLYALQKKTEINARTANMWLNRLRSHTRDQVLEAASGVGESKAQEYQSVTVPVEIYGLLNNARAKMATAVGQEKLTHTAFLEFLGQLILDSHDGNLREIWAKMHGEETG
jgi:hypothetical protein